VKTVVAIVGLAMSAAVAAPAVAAPKVRPLILAAEVRDACEGIEKCSGAWPALHQFCELAKKPVVDADWARAAIPTIDGLRNASCPATRDLFKGDRAAFGVQSLGSIPISQSALLWGATDFMLGRAEAELNAWALQRLEDALCASDGKYARFPAGSGEKLFPKTCNIWQAEGLKGAIGGMGAFQAALRQDFVDVPVIVLKGIVEARRKAAAASAGDGQARALLGAGALAFEMSMAISAMLHGSAPLPSVRELAVDARQIALDFGREPVAAASFIVSAYLNGFPLGPDGDIELPSKGAETEWRYGALALAINANDPTSLKPSWPTGAGAGNLPFNVKALLDRCEQIRELGVRLAELSTKLKNPPAGADLNHRLQIYSRIAEGLIGELPAVAYRYIGGTGADEQTVAVLAAVRQMAHDAAAANFGSLTLDVTQLASLLAGDSLPSLSPTMTRVLSFAADIAQAPNAEAAAAALERFAAPVGSYRRKRTEDGVYGRLNGYVGAAAFVEWMKVRGNDWSTATAGVSPTFWLPLGLEVGVGGFGNGHSLGLFVQAVDLGVLASWRLFGDGGSAAPEVGFRQVFAPGAYFVWGLSSAPLTLAIGGELAPSLRSIPQTTAATPAATVADAYRVGLTLGVDIPLFP
jgi:hypothetical protein